MTRMKKFVPRMFVLWALTLPAGAQLVDNTLAPNAANGGINALNSLNGDS